MAQESLVRLGNREEHQTRELHAPVAPGKPRAHDSVPCPGISRPVRWEESAEAATCVSSHNSPRSSVVFSLERAGPADGEGFPAAAPPAVGRLSRRQVDTGDSHAVTRGGGAVRAAQPFGG